MILHHSLFVACFLFICQNSLVMKLFFVISGHFVFFFQLLTVVMYANSQEMLYLEPIQHHRGLLAQQRFWLEILLLHLIREEILCFLEMMS